jgi:glycosyltransferase involved in cell wall biosynthesis
MHKSYTANFGKLNTAWITWEIQVRNRSMAKNFGVPLYELIVNKSRWLKYPTLIVETLQIIFGKKIDLLFVQNPSIVLSLVAVLLKQMTSLRVIVDAHNAGIYPLEGKSSALNAIAKYIAKNATQVIVSNAYLAKIVSDWGGNPFVMPDPIPDLHPVITTSDIKHKPYFFFICTWADDEPYTEVIAAAALLTDQFDIYITGNYRKKLSESDLKKMPDNVQLLGFVSEADYVNYLASAFAAIDLTTRDNCLVCGAYEAMALLVPAIISDSIVNKETFPQGFIYTHNDANSIYKAMLKASEHHAVLVDGIANMRTEHALKTNQQISDLISKNTWVAIDKSHD